MRQTESREQRRSQTNQNKALKDAKSLQSGGVDWIDSLWFPWWKECPSPSGVDEQLSGVQLSWRLQLFEKLTRICQINIKMTKMVPHEHKVAAVVLSDKYSFALRQTWGKPNPRPTLSRTSGNVPLVLLEERVSVRSYRSDDLNHNMKPDAENSRRIDRGENIRNRVFIATQLISVWGFSFQTKSSEDLCSHLLTAEPLMIRSKLPLSANTLGTRAHPCFHLCVRALQSPLRRTYCTSHSMKTQTNCFTDTANVHALKLTPDWRSDIFWSCVPNSCWSDYIAFQMRYMSPHAAVPGHFMNTNVTPAFEESAEPMEHTTMCTPTETHICPYLFTSNSKANTECALNVSSYQDQRTLHRKVLHAVEVQVQLSRAPSRPQALVWAAHLTHGCVAHGSTYISVFHQNVKDSKWVNHFDNPLPVPPPPPLKAYRLPYSRDEVLSWLHHLTGRL